MNQQQHNDEMLEMLAKIHQQNEDISEKIDNLEHKMTKKAMITGAISGGLSGAIISTGIELIKMKFGG